MALKAYTLDLALQTSSEFAIGNTIPNVVGIATDGEGFIPIKNSTNKTITLSKGFGKFGGRLFEMTEQTVYSWDTGSADADAYLVIDLTKQNSFKGTIEDGTYEFVDNQSSIVLSDTVPSPSANVLVYKLDGNYQNSQNRNFKKIEVSEEGSFNDLNVHGKLKQQTTIKTGSGNGITWTARKTGNDVYLTFNGTTLGSTSAGSYMSGFRVAEDMRPIDTAVNAIRVGSISFTVGALRNDGTLSVNSEVGPNIAIYGSFKYSVA